MIVQTDIRAKQRRSDLDAGLDEALAQTFPASDPFSVGRFTGTEPPARPIDRKAPALVVQRVEPRGRRRKKTSG